jgi:RNA polymerase sigma factor (sigma-70 family)
MMTPPEIARRAVAEHLAARPAAELLAEFAAARDTDAFAALVHQFGPLVLGTCRRVLGPSADADDAFQGVFLALARHAARFRDAKALPAWLHRVSLRVALKLRRSRQPSVPLPEPADPADPFADVTWKDVRRVLDEELDRLPEKYRGPMVLCWLNGLTQDEAAGRLGVSLTTLKRWLEAGRELLRNRLLRRGVAPVVLAAVVFEPSGLRATVPAELTAAAARAAAGVRPVVGVGLARLLAVSAVVAAVSLGLAVSARPTAPVAPPTGSVTAAAPVMATIADPPEPPADTWPAGVVAQFGGSRYQVPDDCFFTAFSPDGKLLALTGRRLVWVYEAATWRLVHKLAADDGDSGLDGDKITFSPDSRYLGYVQNGRAAFLWEVRTGRLIRRYDHDGVPWGWTTYCAFTRDGHFALSDATHLRFHDPATGREVRSVPGGRVVALSPDAKVFIRFLNHDRARSDEPTELVFCDAATGRELHRSDKLARFGGGRNSLAYSPDSQTLAVVPPGGKDVELWDPTGRAPVATLTIPAPVASRLYSTPQVGFTPDGKTIWARLDRSVARWDTATRRPLPPLEAGSGAGFSRVCPLPDGKTLLTPCGNGWVRVWDADTLKERPIPDRYQMFAFSALSRDGRTLAVGDSRGRIDLLDAVTGKWVRTLRESGDPVDWLVFSPDGGLLAVSDRTRLGSGATAPSRVRVLRVGDGKEVWSLEDEDGVYVFRPLGFATANRLIVTHYNENVRVWDIGTGKEELRLPVKSFAAVLSPDGKLLATDEPGGVLVLLDIATGREVRRVETDPDNRLGPRSRAFERLAWSGDGRVLVVALPEDRVAVIDPVAGKELRRFAVFTGEVPDEFRRSVWQGHHSIRGLSLSADGKRLAAVALNGGYVAVWDTTTGKEVARLRHDFDVDSTAITPDGKAVVTFGYHGVGYRWDVEAVIAAPKK